MILDVPSTFMILVGSLAGFVGLALGQGDPPVSDGDPALPEAGVTRLLCLPPGPGNPRNSEGDLLELDDGGLLLVWTAFSDGTGGDHDPASLKLMRSNDGGASWSDPRTIVSAKEGMNVMSATLRRLPDGRVALFYLRKRSLVDCQPMVCFSTDEGLRWSPPVSIVAPDDVGYDVLNNDRVLVDPDGVLLVPVARHAGVGMGPDFAPAGRLRCYRSEDGGASWSSGAWAPEVPGVVLQEPGLFLGRDGALRMYARTNAGVQYIARSEDRGARFQTPRPWTLRSPLSPATVRRLSDGDLLAVWNDPPESVEAARAPRTPLVLARSSDEGATWTARRVLFRHPDGWYCYVSVDPVGDQLFMTGCAGNRRTGNGLETLVVFRCALPSPTPAVEAP